MKPLGEVEIESERYMDTLPLGTERGRISILITSRN